MPTIVKWTDATKLDDSHQVLRKHIDDDEFTVIHEVTDRDPDRVGAMEFVDLEALLPGDYVYVVQNTSSTAGEKQSQPVTVTVPDPGHLVTCMSLKLNPIDVTDTHQNIVDSGMTYTEVNGAKFDQTYIETATAINLTDLFSISINVMLQSNRTSTGCVLCNSAPGEFTYRLMVDTSNRIIFEYVDTAGTVVDITSDINTLDDMTLHNVNITGDSTNDQLTIHVDRDLEKVSSFTGIQSSSSPNRFMIGNNPESDQFAGWMSDLMILDGQKLYPRPVNCQYCEDGPSPVLQPTCDQIAIHIQSDNSEEDDTIYDLSSNGHQGVATADLNHVYTSLLFDTTCIQLDGSGGVHVSDFNHPLSTHNFTIECWFRAPQSNDDSDIHIASCGQPGSFDPITTDWWLRCTNNQIVFNMTDTNGLDHTVTGFRPVTIKYWNHIVVTRKQGHVVLYANDKLVGEQTGLDVNVRLQSPGKQFSAAASLPSDTNWTENHKIVHNPEQDYTSMGSVSLDATGYRLAVQRIRPDTVGHVVSVYELNNGVWLKTHDITSPSENDSFSSFGNQISLSGDTLVIGANKSTILNEEGVVYTYKLDDGEWVRAFGVLRSDAPSESAHFGSGLSMSGDRLAVGFSSPNKSYVLVYNMSPTGWSQTHKIDIDNTTYSYPGRCLSLSSDRLVIGVSHSPDQPEKSDGVLVYQLQSGQWVNTSTLNQVVNDSQQPVSFSQLSTSGDKIVMSTQCDYTQLDCGAYDTIRLGYPNIASPFVSTNGGLDAVLVGITNTVYAQRIADQWNQPHPDIPGRSVDIKILSPDGSSTRETLWCSGTWRVSSELYTSYPTLFMQDHSSVQFRQYARDSVGVSHHGGPITSYPMTVAGCDTAENTTGSCESNVIHVFELQNNTWAQTDGIISPADKSWAGVSLVGSQLAVVDSLDDTTGTDLGAVTILSSSTGYSGLRQTQDVRVTIGEALYSGNFDVPEQLLSNPCPLKPKCNEIELFIQSNTVDGDLEIVDFSSHYRDLILTGGIQHVSPAQATPALHGSSIISMNGTTDSIETETTTNFKFLHDGSSQYTIEMWFYINQHSIDSLGQTRTPLINTCYDSNTVGMMLYASDTGLHYMISKGSGTPVVDIQHFGTVDTNTWYHVSVIHDSDRYNMYVNGQLMDSQLATDTRSTSNTKIPLIIGRLKRDDSVTDTYLNGFVQDVQITKHIKYTSNFSLVETILPNPCPLPPYFHLESGQSIASSSNPITVHSSQLLSNTDQTVILLKSKGDLTVFDQVVPQALQTTTHPFTGIWQDETVWNFNTGDYYHYGPMYGIGTHSYKTSKPVNCNVGKQLRDTGFPVNYNYTTGASFSSAGGPGATGTSCFIRGRDSGAIRRSTWGKKGNIYNDNPNGEIEDRLLYFRIIPEQPQLGVFVSGGSPPWRVHDCCAVTTDTLQYPDKPGNELLSPSSYCTGPVEDRFFNNLSNNIDFIPGESIDIINFDNPCNNSSYPEQTQFLRGLPVQDNISFYNGKYRVAEVTDLTTPLSAGAVFYDNLTTHGGPLQAAVSGDPVPRQAWMRIDMQPIESINIGPTNRYDLVLFATSTLTNGTSADWINRYYVGGAETATYSMKTDMHDNILVCGTYQDHLVVNYNLDINEKYSVVLDQYGYPQDQLQPGDGLYSQAFLTIHDAVSGQVVSCLSTRGPGKNRGSAAAVDSSGYVYMTGQVSGNAKFEADHGWWKYVDRSINTGSMDNTFAFLARISKKDWQYDQHVKYKPIDYSWDWMVFVDAPTHSLSGDRMMCDVGVDTDDNVYTAGYFTGPTEIGKSGAATPDDPEKFQFEQGYKWVDSNSEQVFICKWTKEGICEWSTVTPCDNLKHDSVHIRMHDDLMYFVYVADSNGQQQLNLMKIDTTTGDALWQSTIRADDITCTDISTVDNNNIHLSGTCNSSLLSDDMIITGDTSTISITTGFSLMVNPDATTGFLTTHTGTSVTCSADCQSITSGLASSVGVSRSSLNVNTDNQSIQIPSPGGNKYFIYKVVHEL